MCIRDRVGPEEPLADARVHAIGSDQGTCLDSFAIFESYGDRLLRLFEPDALCAEPDRVGLLAPHRALEHAEEVRAIHREIRIAVALDRDLAQVVKFPTLTAVPDADFLAFGLARERLELFADAEREE